MHILYEYCNSHSVWWYCNLIECPSQSWNFHAVSYAVSMKFAHIIEDICSQMWTDLHTEVHKIEHGNTRIWQISERRFKHWISLIWANRLINCGLGWSDFRKRALFCRSGIFWWVRFQKIGKFGRSSARRICGKVCKYCTVPPLFYILQEVSIK